MSHARIRSTPGMGALYLSVANHSTSDDRLVAVRSTAFKSATAHESVERDGVVRMVPHPEGFALPAGGDLELSPGAKHFMLMGFDPGQAQQVELELEFAHAGPIEVTARVLTPGEAP